MSSGSLVPTSISGAAPAATSDTGAAPAATSDPGAAPAATSDPCALIWLAPTRSWSRRGRHRWPGSRYTVR
ncbi:hypothetical protein CG716_03985 [Mycolicibacterium sphagni]|uniref:Uncharacterized protein n=1 Tax=Mycolicibacterium sphagni TaxID=1786 RepID=A0A255DWW3_9MYCO|nr:hypothetical protein CG716_03985 [Mycolicibacterium sphagni]